MSLRWIDTDKGDAGRPKLQVSIGQQANVFQIRSALACEPLFPLVQGVP